VFEAIPAFRYIFHLPCGKQKDAAAIGAKRNVYKLSQLRFHIQQQ